MNDAAELPSIADLQRRLDYNPATGLLTWKDGRRAGRLAGTVTRYGYVQVSINQRILLAHRVCWAIQHGAWPQADIDHINGDRADNRLSNLRDVSRSVNIQNLRTARSGKSSTNLLGATSVLVGGRQRWRAWIRADGKRHHVGIFDTAEEAHAAYVQAKRQLHPGCTI